MKIQISLILLTTTVLHTYAISQEKDQNLIETTCKNTPNYPLCTTTLRADPGSATADVAGLALIMVEAIKAKTEEGLSAINKLKSQPKLSQALQECAKDYNAVLTADVAVAVNALKGDPKFAGNAMADTVLEANSCDGAFGGVAAPPLSAVNKALRDLAGVARAIIKILL